MNQCQHCGHRWWGALSTCPSCGSTKPFKETTMLTPKVTPKGKPATCHPPC
jgi:hypothetical protein